jgi:hypothetical protein
MSVLRTSRLGRLSGKDKTCAAKLLRNFTPLPHRICTPGLPELSKTFIGLPIRPD